MAIDKIDREELKTKLEEVLGQEPSYRRIDGLNPLHVMVSEREYYIYIKNLSPAQLTNDNDNIWRVQLPIRDLFDTVKNSLATFVLLGYDSQNDVYATWNPTWVKQRLNVAKSVSFYSRLDKQVQFGVTYQISTDLLARVITLHSRKRQHQKRRSDEDCDTRFRP